MPRTCSPRPSVGFTLVELLVVVAIIGVLVSMLIPAIGKAKEESKRVRAAANLRGMVQGFVAYALTQKDQLPTTAYAAAGYAPTYWFNTPAKVDLTIPITAFGLSPLTVHPNSPIPAVNTPGNDSGSLRVWPYYYWPGYTAPSNGTTLANSILMRGPRRMDEAVPKRVMFSEMLQYRADTGLYLTLQPKIQTDVNFQGMAFTLTPEQIIGTYVGYYDGAVEMRKFGEVKSWLVFTGAYKLPNLQP